MSIVEIILISISLAMDAFAVSICKGLTFKKTNIKKAIIIGLYFGLFQGLMPLFGYLLGNTFQELIASIDHWIAFILLGFIGLNMIKESRSEDENKSDDKVDFKTMLPLAIATSIDALTIGITFAFLKVNILITIISIGLITFILSVIGVLLGKKIGTKFDRVAELIGGLILILLGLKILLEHLNII